MFIILLLLKNISTGKLFVKGDLQERLVCILLNQLIDEYESYKSKILRKYL